MQEYATDGHYDPPYARERFGDVFDEFSGPRQAVGKETKRASSIVSCSLLLAASAKAF